VIRLDIQPSALPAKPAEAASSTATEVLQVRLAEVLGDRFHVLQAVAHGGMATIFQAQHRRHLGLFACKVLHPELALRPEVAESFRREALVAARLGDHPNAIPILDSDERNGVFFMLMPFIEGEDLDQVLRGGGPLSRDEGLHFCAQISSLLCHAESHGITHCDVAPGNLRVDLFGRYRLMDYGIARTDQEPGRTLGGTPLYSSPEQILGDPVDIRTDIYALGLVLAEVLTGTPVLDTQDLAAVREQHLRADWSFSPALIADEAVARLLAHMTARDPAMRFQSAFELSGALAALGFERPEFRPRPKALRSGLPANRRSRLS
jgi:eukaryotic-like serine/threonine-protein kinase